MSDLFEQGHACVIGVGGDLPNTVDDAKGFAKILKDPERCAYPESQVQVLTGEQATRANIITALETLASTTNAESTVLVYFSGHGYQLSGAIKSYFLMPHGYDSKDLSETAISGSEFVGLLRDIPAQKLLVLLDCCHAGGLSDLDGFQIAKAPLPPEATKLFAKGGGKMIIGSSMPDELSFAAKPYSVFTYVLIKGLCGEGAVKKDGYIRAADLAMYASRVVSKLTSDKQHPVLNIEKADNFVLAYYAGGNLQPKGLPMELEETIEVESEQEQKADKIADTITQNAKFIININEAHGLHIGGSDRTSHKSNEAPAIGNLSEEKAPKYTKFKSIQQKYLETLSEDIFEEYKGTISEKEIRWFNLRYAPENKNLSHTEIAKKMFDRDSEIELIDSHVVNKIRLKFSKEMKEDGTNIDDLILNNKPLYPATYKWIWEEKFPRDGWSLLKKTITSDIGNERRIRLNPRSQRGPNIKKSINPTINENVEYSIEINSQYDGYLLLINEDEKGDKYLLLPSKRFKRDNELTRISSTRSMFLDNEFLVFSGDFSGNGYEYFVAIVTESLMDLSTITHDFCDNKTVNLNDEDIVELNKKDIKMIFQEIGKQSNSIAFDKIYKKS